jgi:hypothetical protein
MKWLKKFETYKSEDLLNSILDKINKYGITSLNSKEKEFLKNIDNEELKNDILKDKLSVINRLDYDPREDDFFDEVGMNFSKFSDGIIEDGKFEIIYNDLDESDVINFENIFKLDLKKELDGEIVYKPWHEFSKLEKNKFKEFIENYIN